MEKEGGAPWVPPAALVTRRRAVRASWVHAWEVASDKAEISPQRTRRANRNLMVLKFRHHRHLWRRACRCCTRRAMPCSMPECRAAPRRVWASGRRARRRCGRSLTAARPVAPPPPWPAAPGSWRTACTCAGVRAGQGTRCYRFAPRRVPLHPPRCAAPLQLLLRHLPRWLQTSAPSRRASGAETASFVCELALWRRPFAPKGSLTWPCLGRAT